MSPRVLNNLLALCVVALFLLLIIAISGCGTTGFTYTSPDGSSVEWESKTLLKTVDGVEVEWGDDVKKAKLGNSRGDTQATAAMACLMGYAPACNPSP